VTRSTPQPDDGFTLVETVVALGLIMMVGAAMTIFMVNSRRSGHYISLRDTAVQLTVEGMEKARGVRGSALLSGRALCGSACATPVSPAVTSLLGTSAAQRWDAATTSTNAGTMTLPQPGAQPDGSTVAAPGDPEVILLSGVYYKRYYYVGACKQAAVILSTAGVTCDTSTGSAAMVRLVIAVTWADTNCADGLCSYASAALFSSAVTDPFLTG
jgi:type II secretory pathway pseudopilin PulG